MGKFKLVTLIICGFFCNYLNGKEVCKEEYKCQNMEVRPNEYCFLGRCIEEACLYRFEKVMLLKLDDGENIVLRQSSTGVYEGRMLFYSTFWQKESFASMTLSSIGRCALFISWRDDTEDGHFGRKYHRRFEIERGCLKQSFF